MRGDMWPAPANPYRYPFAPLEVTLGADQPWSRAAYPFVLHQHAEFVIMADDPGYPWWVASDPAHPVNATRREGPTPTLAPLTPEPAATALNRAAEALEDNT